MKDLTTMTSATTMTSLEIAELTGKRHDNIVRDISSMFEALEIDALKFEGVYKDAGNRERPMFNLDKELTLTLVSGYNIKMRHRIIKRWQELEGDGSKELTEIERAEKNALLALEHVRILKLNAELENDNKELEITLDKEHEWSSIKRQESRTGKKYNWRQLTAWHNEHGIERKDVFDQNYGTVKSYCKDAWLDVYELAIK